MTVVIERWVARTEEPLRDRLHYGIWNMEWNGIPLELCKLRKAPFKLKLTHLLLKILETEEGKSRKKSQPLDEKDSVIQQLRQQIDDLTLFLEEERLNHKIKNRKTAENHQLHIEQMREEHREHIKSVEDDHNEEIEKLKTDFDQQLQEQRRITEEEKARLMAKMETLQGAFEAYKETVAAEMDHRWQRRVKELHDESDRHTEDELAKQRRVMLHEKSKEIVTMNKEFQRQMQVLVEDHKKEVDHLMEKFAECVQDSEQLKSALLEMQTLKQQREELAIKLKTKTEVLRKTQMELEDKSIKLAGFEKHFAEKVEEVDNRYSLRMQGLMSDNTDLRRRYIKKCEHVFRLKTEKETEQENAVRSRKDALQAVILSRTRCGVSLTALRNEIPNVETVRQSMRKDRPMSAPSTREEVAKGEQLTAVVTESSILPAELPVQQTRKPRPHTSHDSNLYSPRTTSLIARTGIRESVIPSPVNVSNQGLQNLRDQKQFLT